MRFEIGEATYTISIVGKFKGVIIRGQRGKDIDLIIITLAEMKDLHERLKNARALPAYTAYDFDKQILWVHPSPNGRYEFWAKGETKPVVQTAKPGMFASQSKGR